MRAWWIRGGILNTIVALASAVGANANIPESEDEVYPYCGLYSIYAAALHYQLDVQFEQLVDYDYLPNREGVRLHKSWRRQGQSD